MTRSKDLLNCVAYCNNERYHESLDNVMPADVYFGRQYAVIVKIQIEPDVLP